MGRGEGSRMSSFGLLMMAIVMCCSQFYLESTVLFLFSGYLLIKEAGF